MMTILKKILTTLTPGGARARAVRDECATLARWAARSAEDRYS